MSHRKVKQNDNLCPVQDSGSLAVFKVTARDQGQYKGPFGGGHLLHTVTFLVFKSNKPGNPRQVCPELKYVVSGRRPMKAVLLKVSDGASLYMHIQNTTYTEIMHLSLFRTQGL